MKVKITARVVIEQELSKEPMDEALAWLTKIIESGLAANYDIGSKCVNEGRGRILIKRSTT